MTAYFKRLYLNLVYDLQRFVSDEKGDQQTGWLIGVIISVVFGGLIIGGVRAFFPTLWLQITTNIANLW